MTSAAYSFELDIDMDVVQLQFVLSTLNDRLYSGIQQWMQDDLADYLQSRAQARFMAGGDDASGPWAPLKPATQAIRQRRGFPPARPINIRTYDLYNYIVGDRGNVRYSGAWIMTWPGPPPDAETYNKMETAQRGRPVPNTTDRPVVALGVTDYNDILDDLAAFLMDGLM